MARRERATAGGCRQGQGPDFIKGAAGHDVRRLNRFLPAYTSQHALHSSSHAAWRGSLRRTVRSDAFTEELLAHQNAQATSELLLSECRQAGSEAKKVPPLNSRAVPPISLSPTCRTAQAGRSSQWSRMDDEPYGDEFVEVGMTRSPTHHVAEALVVTSIHATVFSAPMLLACLTPCIALPKPGYGRRSPPSSPRMECWSGFQEQGRETAR